MIAQGSYTFGFFFDCLGCQTRCLTESYAPLCPLRAHNPENCQIVAFCGPAVKPFNLPTIQELYSAHLLCRFYVPAITRDQMDMYVGDSLPCRCANIQPNAKTVGLKPFLQKVFGPIDH